MKKHYMFFFTLCLLTVFANNYTMDDSDNFHKLVEQKNDEYEKKFSFIFKKFELNIKPYEAQVQHDCKNTREIKIFFEKRVLTNLLKDHSPVNISRIFLLHRANKELECVKQCAYTCSRVNDCDYYLHTFFKNSVSVYKINYYCKQIPGFLKFHCNIPKITEFYRVIFVNASNGE